jgi:Ca2+-binding RTX toxin-like protein
MSPHLTRSPWRSLLAGAVAASIMAVAAEASALTLLNDPYGNAASQAFIGRNTSNGNHYILWKNKATGACSSTFLGGSTGFNADFEVHALGGDDYVQIYPYTSPSNFCGMSVGIPNYNGHFIDLYGGDGRDSLYGSTGDSWVNGEAGNDTIQSGGFPGDLCLGSAGNDTVIGVAVDNQTIHGDDGDDCLNVSGTSTDVSCGNGNDKWYGPGTRPADCETTFFFCCPGLIC